MIRMYSKDKLAVQRVRRFLGSEKGNIATLSALLLVPLTVLLGGAVDFMRFATARAEIQGAIDSGILSAAALSNERPVRDVVIEYLSENIDSQAIDLNNIVLDVTGTVDESGTEVLVTATYTMQTYFAKMVGIDEMTVIAQAGGRQEWNSLEVAMVLDISSSMNNTKMNYLKIASKEFIDEILKEDVIDITSISVIPFGGTVNIGSDYFDLVDETYTDNNDDTDYEDGNKWHGCVELKPSDYNDNDFGDDESYDVVPHFWKWRNFNPWCPKDENESIFLSNDATELKALVDDFSRSDGTGMDIGAVIGYKSLSPNLRGRLQGDFAGTRPTDWNSETLKIMVIMTDGGITSQFRPHQNGCIRAKNNWNGSNKNQPDNGSTCQTDLYRDNSKVYDGTYTDFYDGTWDRHNKNQAVDYFEDTCDEAKEDGVVIYTIGFQITDGSAQDIYLENCASSLSQYYFVENTDISTAFSAIAASINGIRLTH